VKESGNLRRSAASLNQEKMTVMGSPTRSELGVHRRSVQSKKPKGKGGEGGEKQEKA
jgi:hypothetical protein